MLVAYFIKQRVSGGDRPGGEGRFTRERDTAPVQQR